MTTTVTLLTLLMPMALLLVGFVLNEVVRPRLAKTPKPDPDTDAPVVVGQTVDWASTAYGALKDDLTRERDEHAACHAAMREHDLDIPHD